MIGEPPRHQPVAISTDEATSAWSTSPAPITRCTFGSYFAGSLLVASLNGLFILTVGLLLGVPLAPLAALWAVLTNFIPQIGGFLGGSFFVLLAFTESRPRP